MDTNVCTPETEIDSKPCGIEVLTFVLGNEHYAVDIQRVQELRTYSGVTRIANMPEYIKGVMNLRGAIVPVLDMRLKFNLPAAPYDDFTVVMVLTVRDQIVGLVVDSVSDVVRLAAGDVKPPPGMTSGPDTAYVTGLATLDDRMLIVVDIERLAAADELATLAPALA